MNWLDPTPHPGSGMQDFLRLETIGLGAGADRLSLQVCRKHFCPSGGLALVNGPSHEKS